MQDQPSGPEHQHWAWQATVYAQHPGWPSRWHTTGVCTRVWRWSSFLLPKPPLVLSVLQNLCCGPSRHWNVRCLFATTLHVAYCNAMLIGTLFVYVIVVSTDKLSEQCSWRRSWVCLIGPTATITYPHTISAVAGRARQNLYTRRHNVL